MFKKTPEISDGWRAPKNEWALEKGTGTLFFFDGNFWVSMLDFWGVNITSLHLDLFSW